jgi:hypothetical protein
MNQILALDASNYRRHLIHGDNRVWAETNCYTDVIIELLHGLGHEPIAALPFTLGIDFEGDQWTFFKFPDSDIGELYGLDIQELTPWRNLVEHIDAQVGMGRPVLVELDSFFLPDTAGTAYQIAHVKSTVAVNSIDIEKRFLGYFHNQGYYELHGENFENIFQLQGLVHERMLPPYVEFVKTRVNHTPLNNSELLAKSLGLLNKHLQLVPAKNPFTIFKEKFKQDLEWLMQADMDAFHIYSFSNLRQYGACFELTETYLRWLSQNDIDGLDICAAAFNQIAQTAKAFQFQLARSMARKKPIDLAALDTMAAAWDQGMSILNNRFG